MWNLTKIEINNFFSHQHSEYEFKNNCCTLIVGENRDKGGNNGAGKTTLFEAITLALTGNTLRGLKKESFINWDYDQCSISLSLDNEVLKQTLTINRQYFRGSKSAKVELIEDGEINSHITSVNEADKRIAELIGISREDLLRYFIISQDNLYTFFTAGDNEKKEVLNRITSADMINPIIEHLVDDKKEWEKRRQEVKDKISEQEVRKVAFTEQAEAIREAANNDSEIKDKEERIKRCEKQREALDEEISELSQRITDIENKIKKISIKDIDVDKIKKQIQRINKHIDANENTKSENKSIIRYAKSDLSGKVICPNCGENFMPDSELKLSVEETENLLKAAEQENKTIDNTISKLETEKDKFNDKIKEYEEKKAQIEEYEDKIKRLNRWKKDKMEEQSSIYEKIKRYKNEIDELKNHVLDSSALKKINDKIKECEKKEKEFSNELKPIEDELEEINFWSYYMGKNGFKTMLANKAISVIEGSTNSYLRKFKSDLTVNVNGFTILKDGTVREKIDIYVLQDGMNPQVFMGMSGGERGRVKLAGILALQHLINMSLNGRGLNLVILDETLEGGIDIKGTMEFMSILENVGGTILLITQKIDEINTIQNKLRVIKEDGVSHYEV
nr:MAG TPA: STRUCTURAL MAINTENANCE OF CHROMOSOMES PROTEIN [Caudoviricetes sp.]